MSLHGAVVSSATALYVCISLLSNKREFKGDKSLTLRLKGGYKRESNKTIRIENEGHVFVTVR